MGPRLLLFGFLLTFISGFSESYTFDWTDPGRLTPSYPAPNMNNREGEYISLVTFTSGPVSFTVDDNDVKELSQKARFYYGYDTQVVELRAYVRSTINIEVTPGFNIESIKFEEKEFREIPLWYEGSDGTFKNDTWTVKNGSKVTAVNLDVDNRIRCISTVVTVSKADNFVDTVGIETKTSAETWYTLQGVALSQPPRTGGLYILNKNGKSVLKIVK